MVYLSGCFSMQQRSVLAQAKVARFEHYRPLLRLPPKQKNHPNPCTYAHVLIFAAPYCTTQHRYGEHFQHSRQRILLALPVHGNLFLCSLSADALLSEFRDGVSEVSAQKEPNECPGGFGGYGVAKGVWPLLGAKQVWLVLRPNKFGRYGAKQVWQLQKFLLCAFAAEHYLCARFLRLFLNFIISI